MASSYSLDSDKLKSLFELLIGLAIDTGNVEAALAVIREGVGYGIIKP